jgi:DNA-binding beta-propeller fold protein YncE
MLARITSLSTMTAGLVLAAVLAGAQPAIAGSVSYVLDPTWPQMPAGMYFGTLPAFPTPRERAAAAQAHPHKVYSSFNEEFRAEPRQPGVSGLAIDSRDHIYVFNRGAKPVMIFDRAGHLLRAGADQVINGKKLNPNWVHSGAVDGQGNVYVIEREADRIVKLDPTLHQFLMQLGVTDEPGTDATHLDLPSGIAVLKSGNIVVTDGYGNNRVVLYDPHGKFLKQIGKGEGGPNDKGSGPGEWNLPHKLAVDANENLYVCEETNARIQVLDKNLNFERILPNMGWVPWDFAISRKGDEGYGFVADYKNERVVKIALSDGRILAAWGKEGRGPGEFDWIHEVVVDSKGAVYAGDTYGQRVQKFVPVAATGQTGGS